MPQTLLQFQNVLVHIDLMLANSFANAVHYYSLHIGHFGSLMRHFDDELLIGACRPFNEFALYYLGFLRLFYFFILIDKIL